LIFIFFFLYYFFCYFTSKFIYKILHFFFFFFLNKKKKKENNLGFRRPRQLCIRDNIRQIFSLLSTEWGVGHSLTTMVYSTTNYYLSIKDNMSNFSQLV
ncbi:hypothetical protein AKH09_16185, partial [Vibrio parahaemolyticus]